MYQNRKKKVYSIEAGKKYTRAWSIWMAGVKMSYLALIVPGKANQIYNKSHTQTMSLVASECNYTNTNMKIFILHKNIDVDDTNKYQMKHQIIVTDSSIYQMQISRLIHLRVASSIHNLRVRSCYIVHDACYMIEDYTYIFLPE